MLTSVGNILLTLACWSRSGTIGRAIVTCSYQTDICIISNCPQHFRCHDVQVKRLPHPPCCPGSGFRSKTTLWPMSWMPKDSRPRLSPSPCGSPESSKRALKDSRCGVTNSLRIGTVCSDFGGFLNFFSRETVPNVSRGVREPSGIVGAREAGEGQKVAGRTGGESCSDFDRNLGIQIFGA